jgi:multisubunit Na+/H+ antiporter MnhE subunit
VARLIETLVWWVALCGLWLLTLSTFPIPELVAAVVLALPCAAAATVARRAVGASWRVRPGWARWLLPLPAAVLADTVRVLAAVLRRPLVRAERGRLLRVGPRPESDARYAATQRALAVIALSLPPGSVVVGADDDPGRDGDELLLHVLADGPPRMNEVIER